MLLKLTTVVEAVKYEWKHYGIFLSQANDVSMWYGENIKHQMDAINVIDFFM